jgi:flavin-dependent dehydrogenase
MEQNLLYKNPFLKKIFQESIFIWEKPLTISQINFSQKELIKNEIICIGDAAGMIQPLCGNGMSMAFHAAFMLSKNIHNTIDHKELKLIQKEFHKEWHKVFSMRLKTARLVEKLFGKKFSTNIAISLLKKSPLLTQKIIQLTHGKDFFCNLNVSKT